MSVIGLSRSVVWLIMDFLTKGFTVNTVTGICSVISVSFRIPVLFSLYLHHLWQPWQEGSQVSYGL